jgi:hypothetical protein
MGKKMSLPAAAVQQALAGEKAAKKSNFDQAVLDYQKASDLAPWWGACYFNLALAQKAGGLNEGAVENLKLYLLAEPRAKNADKVKKKISAWEVPAEAQAKENRAGRSSQEGFKVGFDASAVYGDFIKQNWAGAPNGWEPISTFGGDAGLHLFTGDFFISPGFEYQNTNFSTYNTAGRATFNRQLMVLLARLKLGAYMGDSDAFWFVQGGYGTSQVTEAATSFSETSQVFSYGGGLGFGKRIYGFLEVEETESYQWKVGQGSQPADSTLFTTRFLCGVGCAIY